MLRFEFCIYTYLLPNKKCTPTQVHQLILSLCFHGISGPGRSLSRRAAALSWSSFASSWSCCERLRVVFLRVPLAIRILAWVFWFLFSLRIFRTLISSKTRSASAMENVVPGRQLPMCLGGGCDGQSSLTVVEEDKQS